MSKIIEMYIASAAGKAMAAMNQLQLIAGKGVKGDRYYSKSGTFSKKLAGLPDFEITLIESENIIEFNHQQNVDFAYSDFRRNVITQGIDLNALEGKEFMLGNCRLRGVRLCEPCAYLSGLLTPKLLPAMVGKSGLRAQILTGGSLNIGDGLTTTNQ